MRIELTVSDNRMFMGETYDRVEKAKELITTIDNALKTHNAENEDRFRILKFEMEEHE